MKFDSKGFFQKCHNLNNPTFALKFTCRIRAQVGDWIGDQIGDWIGNWVGYRIGNQTVVKLKYALTKLQSNRF